MTALAWFVGGWAATRLVATLTRNSPEGSMGRRIHIAVVGPWRGPK